MLTPFFLSEATQISPFFLKKSFHKDKTPRKSLILRQNTVQSDKTKVINPPF
jgi:hypothetical protein